MKAEMSTPVPIANRWYDQVFRFCLYAAWVFNLFFTMLAGLMLLFPAPDTDVLDARRQIDVLGGILSYPQIRLDSLMVAVISLFVVPVLLVIVTFIYQWIRRLISGERLIVVSPQSSSFCKLIMHSGAFLLIVVIFVGKAYGVVVEGDVVALIWLQFLATVLLGVCFLIAFGVGKLLRIPLPVCYFLMIMAMIALPNNLFLYSA